MFENGLGDFPIEWEKRFTPSTLAKGKSYQRAGRVSSWHIDVQNRVLTAKVSGSLPEPYSVMILWGNGSHQTIESRCSCPLGVYCKHVTAAIYQAQGKIPKVQAPQVTQPKPKMLEPVVQRWLEHLQQAVAPAPVEAENSGDSAGQRIAYVLNLQAISGASTHLTVVPHLVQRLAQGGYGAAKVISLEYIIRNSPRPPYLRAEDIAIWKRVMLQQPGGSYYMNYQLAGGEGSALLEVMLRTGYCHWKGAGKKHPALTHGQARLAKLAWRANAQGMQSPGFDVTPAATSILPVAPPWYLDETTGTCGPLDTGLPPALAEAWINAPTVTPDQAEILGEELSRRFPELQIPAPFRIEVQMVKSVKPVPCLRLFCRKARSDGYGYFYSAMRGLETMDLNLARLEFDYEGTRVDPGSPQDTIESFRENTLRRLRRNFKVENAEEFRLMELGFMRAEDAFIYHRLGKDGNALALKDANAWFHFCQKELPLLKEAGWRVEIDESFQYRLAEPEGWYAGADDTGIDWFGVEIGVQLDGQKLNLMPILLEWIQRNPRLLSDETLAHHGADAKLPVQLPDGRLLPFPVRRLKEMMGVLLELFDPKSLDRRGRLRLSRLRAAELSRIAEDSEWRWMGGAELKELSRKLHEFGGIQSIAPPASLRATLRGYQQEGLNWLQFLREYELGGILADDMGLGKTVQALAHLLHEHESARANRPSLVIAPTSLMTNWRQETERFAPELKVLVLHGTDRKQHFERVANHDLIITSYPLLPRDQAVLLAADFHYVILDEAQFIKNPKTQYAQIVCQLKARHRLCLTGTPMENHLGELWSLFHFLLPGFLGDELRFRQVFRTPIEKGRSDERRKVLAQRVRPFVLRRRKEDVVKELPPKTEIVQNVELTGAQRDLYETIRLAMHARVHEEVGKKGLSRAHIVILDALLKLRQVCCDPRLLSLDAAKKVRESAKLELLVEQLPEMISEGRRVLLFSQFTSMLALIEPEMAKAKIPYVLLTGQTTDRATPIERFQKGEAPLFLISLKAGGTGLNLTAADTVIHYDPWWNPAVENQATDRAHRIGQIKSVFVYKLMTVGTVEEKILELQKRKKELVEGLLNEERKDNIKLSAEDLDVLFAPIG